MNIKHYRIEIILKAGIIGKEGVEFIEEEIEVLAQNEFRFCLNNKRYTTVSKEKTRAEPVIDKPSIYSNVNNSCFGTRIVYSLYTIKAKRKSTIKKEIQKYVDDKFAVFVDIDLSFLE